MFRKSKGKRKILKNNICKKRISRMFNQNPHDYEKKIFLKMNVNKLINKLSKN